MNEFLSLLNKICNAYDELYGAYPENKYEGNEIYKYAVKYIEEEVK